MKQTSLIVLAVLFSLSMAFAETKEFPQPKQEPTPQEQIICEKYGICTDSDPGCTDEEVILQGDTVESEQTVEIDTKSIYSQIEKKFLLY